MRKRTDILSPGDVKKGEVILALLYRERGKPVAHLLKIVGVDNKAGLRRIFGIGMWRDIRDSFLHHIGGK